MGRSEKQLDPRSGPLARLALDLRALRRQAGAPTYRELSRIAGYSPSALSAAASGANLPSAAVLASYVRACGGDVDEWLRRRAEVALSASAPAPATAPDPGAAPNPAAAPSRTHVPAPALEQLSERPHQPTPPRAPRQATRRHRFTRRTAGLLAAAIVGSMATVLPMAVWGAPSCLTTDHGHSAPTTHCQPLSTN